MTATISDAIRERVRQAEKAGASTYAIAKESRLSWHTLKRFADGANIRSDHLDRLAEYFGVVLVDAPKSKPKKGK